MFAYLSAVVGQVPGVKRMLNQLPVCMCIRDQVMSLRAVFTQENSVPGVHTVQWYTALPVMVSVVMVCILCPK